MNRVLYCRVARQFGRFKIGMSKFKISIGVSVVVVLAALILGCGGGGGGNGTSSGTTYTAYQVSVTYPNNSGQMVDPGTLFIGDTLQLEITARDKSGALVIVPASGWLTNAPANVATVTSSGLLTAVGSSSGSSYTVFVRLGGTTHQATIQVAASQNVVTGLVRNVNSVGIQSVKVLAYDASKTLVAKTTTVPSTAKKFTVDLSVADPTGAFYYSQYWYNTGEFITGTSCLAPLPSSLSATAVTALPSDIIPDLKSLGPPPPPTQCIGP